MDAFQMIDKDPNIKVLGISDDVTAVHDPVHKIWKLSNDTVSQSVQIDSAGGFALVELRDRAKKTDYAYSVPVFGFDLCIGRENLKGISEKKSFSFSGCFCEKTQDNALKLEFNFIYNPAHLKIILVYICHPHVPVIENKTIIENIGSSTIRKVSGLGCNFYTLQFLGPSQLLWSGGCGGPGHISGAGVFPPDSFICNKREIKDSEKIEIYSGGSVSSRDNIPWFALSRENKEGVFFGLCWSGEWRATVRKELGIMLTGMALGGFSCDLYPEKRIESPLGFIGVYCGSFDEAAKQTHEYCGRCVLPRSSTELPAVQYNTWYQYFTGVGEEALKDEVELAKQLGIEVFCVDAGWHKDSASGGNNLNAGLGDWQESVKNFPSGLAKFSDLVHSRGMKFGLWVEPERISPSTFFGLKQGSWQEGWLKTVNGRRTDLLCLSQYDCREWIKNWVSRIVNDYKVDWLRWDHNAWSNCDSPEHGHQENDSNYRHVAGLYEVLEFLKKKFPRLVIENCSGGGNRMDFGIMKYCSSFWVSNDAYSAERNRFHFYSASHPFPPAMLNFRIALPKDEKITPDNIKYLCRSRMLGALGFSLPLKDTSIYILQEAEKEIALYKRVRHFLRGTLYRIFPQSADLCGWDGFQYRLPQSDESLILLFRMDGPSETKAKLFFLDPDKGYCLTDEDDGSAFTATGRRLTEEGFSCLLEKPRSCCIARVAPIKK